MAVGGWDGYCGPGAGWKKNFQTRSILEKSEFMENKEQSRVSEGAASTAGRLPGRPGRADPLCGLVANFYSLKTKKIPAGRMALGNWSGCYKVTTW